jgi:hypothetical protein
MNKQYLLATLSSTQRLVIEVVEINGETRVELRKEWRHSRTCQWAPSKGITIPKVLLKVLKDILTAIEDGTPSVHELELEDEHE